MEVKKYLSLYILLLLIFLPFIDVEAKAYTYYGHKINKYEINNYTFSAEPTETLINESNLIIQGFTVETNALKSAQKVKNACIPTAFDFTILNNSLKDIQTKLGQAVVFRPSPEEEAPLEICYRSAHKSDSTIVIFDSGPMGGWKAITSFRIISDSPSFKWIDKCSKSPYVSKNVQTKSGIRLGITKKQLKRILGNKPNKVIGNNIFFIYETKMKMTKNDMKNMGVQWSHGEEYPYFDVTSTVHAIFLNSKLIFVEIRKIESY